MLSGLEVGGRERVVLELARRARRDGLAPRLLLFETPFRNTDVDFDPGDLPWEFLPRRPGSDLRYPLALSRRLRELEADVVHAHNDTAVFFAGTAARLLRRPGPALIATFHTKPHHVTRKGRLSTRWAARRADAVTGVSEDLAQVVVNEGWVPRCDTLWNGIDLETFTPAGPDGGWRTRLAIPSDAVLVGHIGRFDPIKRHEDLLAAARRLEDLAPAVVLVLVGQGPDHDAIRARTADRTNLRFAPRVDDVAAFLRELDVFTLCSDHEAAPRVLLEALACGRPIVATAVGGIPGLLTDDAGEVAGVLVPPRDPARLADALAALAVDAERRAHLARQARVRAGAFSAEDEWAQYLELYRRAWSARHGQPLA